MTTIAEPRFAGVIKIVRFNVQFYLLSAVSLAVAIMLLVSRRLPQWLDVAVLCGAAVAAFWTLSSLLVSWYVYDHAGVTRWQWLRDQVPARPHRWANIHAGLDESTAALGQLFAGTEGAAIDIYESSEMTEPSIARARRLHPSPEPFATGRHDALPLSDDDRDAIFLLFSAHEVRVAEHRTQLFRETARVLRRTDTWSSWNICGTGRTSWLSDLGFFTSTQDGAGLAAFATPVSLYNRKTRLHPLFGVSYCAGQIDEAQFRRATAGQQLCALSGAAILRRSAAPQPGWSDRGR